MSHNGRSNAYNWKGYKTPFADPVTFLLCYAFIYLEMKFLALFLELYQLSKIIEPGLPACWLSCNIMQFQNTLG